MKRVIVSFADRSFWFLDEQALVSISSPQYAKLPQQIRPRLLLYYMQNDYEPIELVLFNHPYVLDMCAKLQACPFHIDMFDDTARQSEHWLIDESRIADYAVINDEIRLSITFTKLQSARRL